MNACRDNDIISSRKEREREELETRPNLRRDYSISPGGEGKKERNKHWRRKGGNSRPEKDYPFDPSF